MPVESQPRTLYLVSHTHWDREWYRTFQQFRLRLVRLVDDLLDILDGELDYRHFMLDGQTIVLEDYLQIRPEREADLRRLVQSGRLLIGPWYLLPDEFLVSPEATVRNLLEGERVARRFGPKMMVGYVPDPFGHIGQLPQILRGFGIQTASVMRGLGNAEPCEFWWQAPDGSRVLMAYLRDSYGNAAGALNGGVEAFPSAARALAEQLAPHVAAPHLLLMHGTDHMPPQPETSAAVAYAAGRLGEDRLVHATLPDYFAAVLPLADGFPVVHGELRGCSRHPLLPGVLSTRMWIKQRNWACETLLEQWAEPFSTWSAWLVENSSAGLRRPQGALRDAWRLLMQCHPHDSICGCSIDAVHEEMRPRFDQVEQVGEEITRASLEDLAAAAATADGAPEGALLAVVVFNPTGSPRSDLLRVVLEGLPGGAPFEIVDEDGQALPHQDTGLGSSELINIVMPRRDFRNAFAAASNGVVMDLNIRALEIRREASRVQLDVVLAEKGAPDLETFERGRQAVEALLADESVAEFHVRARTASAAEVLLPVAHVPGHGFRTLWVRAKPVEEKAPERLSRLARGLLPLAASLAAQPAAQKVLARLSPDPSAKPPYRIENEFFVVEAQPDGTLAALDRRSGRTYRGLNRFIDGGDRGDEYNYSPPEADQLLSPRLVSVQVERGTVTQALEVSLLLRLPEGLAADRRARSTKRVDVPIRTRVTLVAGVPRIEVHSEVDNRARDHRLRAHFSAPFSIREAGYDGHYEIVRRPVGQPGGSPDSVEQPRPEAPMRAFVEIGDGETGLLVAARGLPEVEARSLDGGSEIALTLLRCVGWLSRDDFPERKGHAGPAYETPGAQLPGRWSFDYAVIPGSAGSAAERQALRELAWEFQAPLRAAVTGLHAGTIPPRGSFLQVEPPEYQITAVKAAEDGQGWLTRGVNLSGEDLPVTLRTLRPFARAWRASLAEERLEDLGGPGQEVTLTARAHEVVTVRFAFDPGVGLGTYP